MPINNQENEMTQCCAACGKADKGLKQCSGCKTVVYCDRSCQLAHRKDHKAECKRIEKALKAVATMPKTNSGLLSDIKKYGLPMTAKDVLTGTATAGRTQTACGPSPMARTPS